MAVKIKICGIKDYEDALLCVEEGVDALGFIFYPGSPRFILTRDAKKIVKNLPCFISKVGVFVDENEQVVRQTADIVGLDTLQFHGKESAGYCERFKKDFKVIKSFFPKNENALSAISKYKVDGVLLDIHFEDKERAPGAVLNLRLVEKMSQQIRFLILSGGLSHLNVERLLSNIKPYGVDVARGVEEFPGKKDRELVRKFIKTVRKMELRAHARGA